MKEILLFTDHRVLLFLSNQRLSLTSLEVYKKGEAKNKTIMDHPNSQRQYFKENNVFTNHTNR